MREFLEDANLEKDKIDDFMSKYGKALNSEKEKVVNLQKEIDDLKKENKEFKSTIKDLNNTIDTNNKSLENLQNVTNENKDLKAQLEMNESNVKKEFSEFVASKVMANVNDDVDFKSALAAYKQDNPQYFGDTVIKKVQSSPSLNSGGSKPQTTSDIMNDIIRNSK